MSKHSTDAEARLRAADPAADSEPDLTALRAAVDRRVAAGEVGDDLAARRRRTPWPVRVAGAAAAALLLGGGGGYAIGVAAGSGDAPAGSVITLGQPAAPGAGPEMAEGGAGAMGGPEAGRGMAASGAEDAAVWSGYGGRTLFRQSGLSTEGGTAAMWGFDAQSAFSEATAARAAEVLGVPGTPRLVDGLWFVGDEGGAQIQLYPDGTASLHYWDRAKDPWRCDGAVVDSEGDEGVSTMPVDPCTQRDLGPAPTGDEATSVLSDIMTGLGLDVSDWELEVESWGDADWSYVTAHHVVDGRRTGVQWNATLSGAGLQSLYGSTAPVVGLGDYEVVSPAAAVERLMDPRFSSSGPVAWAAGREPAGDGWSSSPQATVPGTPASGAQVSWPVQEVRIVEARLGGAQHWQPDGSVLLVPTYELEDAAGAIWTVVAVADRHLDTVAR